MVGILLSYWGGLFSGAMLVSGYILLMMQKCAGNPADLHQFWGFGGLPRDFRLPPSQAVSVYAEVSTHVENLNKSEMCLGES